MFGFQVLSNEAKDQRPKTLRRRKREWILPPAKLMENVDYTQKPYITKVSLCSLKPFKCSGRLGAIYTVARSTVHLFFNHSSFKLPEEKPVSNCWMWTVSFLCCINSPDHKSSVESLSLWSCKRGKEARDNTSVREDEKHH